MGNSLSQRREASERGVVVGQDEETASHFEKLHQSRQALSRFKDLYKVLDKHSLSHELLSEVYSEGIHFEDSLHSVDGLSAMFKYFEGLYENVKSIEFIWHDESVSKECVFVSWTMVYQHPLVNAGKSVRVEGSSRLLIENGLVLDHRDYFDAGEMLYEHLPVLGFAIRKLKKRLV